ncbi:MAG: putative toxin-antitoxin system toxin component, PIN family [Prevotella sp.]
MIYAVIDTNVLVSSLLTHDQGVATAKVLDSIAMGDIVCVYNEDILMEYREVLHRPKFKFPERKIDSLLAFITQKGIHSDRIPYEGNMPDEKDRPFYEVSLSVDDSFLVTGNLKHFPATPKVVTPSQIIAIIEEQ